MNDGLVDTNIVLAAINPGHDRYHDALRLIADLGLTHRLIVPPQVWFETYVVLNRPTAVNGHGMSPHQACFEIDLARAQFIVLPDASNLLDEWLDLCRTHDVSGKPAHAAYARVHGIETFATLNPRDFARYVLKVIGP